MSTREPHATIVVGLAFGDCGKGTVVDYLTRRHGAHTVVRFNGGPQAAHTVATGDGRRHTFAQFGAGSFVPGVRTLLSRFVLIEPYALLNEAAHLAQVGVGDAMGRLVIDERCPVITPAHQAANRLRELARGDAAHGTCGAGVGEAAADLVEHAGGMLYARDLHDRATVARRLAGIRDRKLDELRHEIAVLRTHPRARAAIDTLLDPGWLGAAVDTYAAIARKAAVAGEAGVRAVLAAGGSLVFEGAQGVLLDEWYGFHPHTTWSTTTFENAQTLLDEAGHGGGRTRVGVLRSYLTRHGPGPFVTEDASLRGRLREPDNNDGGWQGSFRVGTFDAVAARYALAVTGPVDVLAVTHLDRLAHLPPRVCTAYQLDGVSDSDASQGGLLTRAGGRVTDIRVGARHDLAQRQRLTRLLHHCRPEFAALPDRDVNTFLAVVESALHCAVGLTSAGPTAREKQVSAGGREHFGPWVLRTRRPESARGSAAPM